ncbi:MAG: glycosyltransferase, partial [Candidatus Thorarchaeota archaeon]
MIQKIKICYLIDGLRLGGKERQLMDLIKGLVNQSFLSPEQIMIISFYKDGSMDEIFKKMSIQIKYSIRKFRKDIFLFFRLYKIVKEFSPNIIHTWDPMTTIYALPIAKLLKIKFINGFIRFAAPVKPFSKFWIVSKLTFKFSDLIIANSLSGLHSFNLKLSKKNYCIYNGFNFSRINTVENPNEVKKRYLLKTKYIVGMVGNFVEAKDYETYLMSAQNILKKRCDVTFICIGSGHTLRDMKKLIDPKYHDNIKFFGRVMDVESIINIFDIGVLICNTNGHAEGISNSIMEYMAFGKPVIVTDSGGNKELVNNNKVGYIVKPFDQDELSEKINSLLNDKIKRIEMGKSGKEKIVN